MSSLQPTAWPGATPPHSMVESVLVIPLNELHAHPHLIQRGADRPRSPVTMPVLVLAVLFLASAVWVLLQQIT